MNNDQLDTVGYWTEIKFHILEGYAKAYANVLKNQKHIKHVAYIDAFAGAGARISKTSGEQIAGSPAKVLAVLRRDVKQEYFQASPAAHASQALAPHEVILSSCLLQAP